MIRDKVSAHAADRNIEPIHKDFRPGDVRHSLADIGKAKALLGYHPEYSVKQGLDRTAEWYIKNLATPPR
jgi:UDP-N-acetylglucosamine 4-epimerase